MDKLKNFERGVSLIEVLITLVVLGMGLMSLAKFQSTVMKDNSLGKERSVAIHLAEQKMEDLRNFSVETAPNPQPSQPLASYAAIGSDSGGWLNVGGGLLLPSVTVPTALSSNSNVQYTRSWRMRNWYYDNSLAAPNAVATLTHPNPVPPIPPLKQVLVTIKWPDKTGALPADCAFPDESQAAAADTRVCLMSFIAKP